MSEERPKIKADLIRSAILFSVFLFHLGRLEEKGNIIALGFL